MSAKIILAYLLISFLIVGVAGLGAAVPVMNATVDGTMQISKNPLAPSPPISCTAICAMTGKACCNGACVDTQIDSKNCGKCGNKCIMGKTCIGGKCINIMCPKGRTICNGACVNIQTDPKNCGKCGNNCGGWKWCVNGQCVKPNICTANWKKCLGGSGYDAACSVLPTADGGYVVAGDTASDDGDVSGNHGGGYWDGWIVKIDNCGNIKWQKCLGGSNLDSLDDIEQTTDGGYITVGETYSNDGDVIGTHGGPDIWVVKLDPDGNVQWQKCIGGSDEDTCIDGLENIHQTNDGGYVLVGTTNSVDGDADNGQSQAYFWDILVVKLDKQGAVQWHKRLGSSDGTEYGSCITQTTDGGYIVAGSTFGSNLNEGEFNGYHNGQDIWLVKLSSIGAVQWDKCLGGSGYEYPDSVQLTSDGGYIIAGYTDSSNGDISGNHGGEDAWVVKLDSAGEIQWQKCLGGSGDDSASSIQQTKDGGYIVSGLTNSTNGEVSGNHGGIDCWVIKLASNGDFLWQKCLGGSGDEVACNIRQTVDGDYILSGRTSSSDGDVSGNHGGVDAWVVRMPSS